MRFSADGTARSVSTCTTIVVPLFVGLHADRQGDRAYERDASEPHQSPTVRHGEMPRQSPTSPRVATAMPVTTAAATTAPTPVQNHQRW